MNDDQQQHKQKQEEKNKNGGKIVGSRAYALVGQLLTVPENVKVLDGPELGTTAIDIPLNVAHTITGVIPSGHVLIDEALGRLAMISKVALPPSTLTVWL